MNYKPSSSFIFLVGLVLFCGFYLNSCLTSPSRTTSKNLIEHKPRPVKLEVSHTSKSVVVTNKDQVDWKECDIEINDTSMFSQGYKSTYHDFISGKTSEVQLAGFLDSKSNRFKILNTAITKLSVCCRKPERNCAIYDF